MDTDKTKGFTYETCKTTKTKKCINEKMPAFPINQKIYKVRQIKMFSKT